MNLRSGCICSRSDFCINFHKFVCFMQKFPFLT